MASGKKSALLSSLAAYGDDSEQDSDQDTDEHVSASYGDDDIVQAEDGDERELGNEESDDDDGNSICGAAGTVLKIYMLIVIELLWSSGVEVQQQGALWSYSVYRSAQFSEKVRNMSPEEIRIPPEPPGRCPTHLQEKIHKLYERKMQGDFDTNSHIQKKKEFRNPSIYEKLIQYCGIDELGTNYPKDMFDPHGWSEDSYYESLAKAQKIEMEKLEKAKKERTKIEFVTGMKKGTSTNSSAVTTNTTNTSTDAQKRKSKWDSAVPVTLSQPVLLTTTATLPGVVSVTTTASGTKTTVISAVGTILKKAKQ
ncbi:SAP30-binding protein [Silurus asotus]|uniref:SAP30-binding protein n=1 Tax=Silurus asotus TaxID=30991 RepID=A0AAD5FKM0_SILAS|nr:SAP30-binding protein [Silurus asotus]